MDALTIHQQTWLGLFSLRVRLFVPSDLPGRREAWACCSRRPFCSDKQRPYSAMSAWRFPSSCGSDQSALSVLPC